MSGWKPRTSGGSGRGARATRSTLIRRYDAYLQVLRANADVLELLSELEDVAVAGISCGRRRFRAMITRLGVQVYAMARMLRILGGDRYDGLFPAIERIRRELEDALAEAPPPNDGPWLLPLGTLGAADHDLVGGKAANLGRLIAAADLPVPAGFVVSVAAFRAFLRHNGLEDTVRVLSDALDPDEPLHLVETAERLQHEVLRGSLPGGLEEALRSAADGLLAGARTGARLAVRSSASGEDGEISFAGQYTSVLDATAEEIGDAYLRVLAGFFNPRAVLMRLRRGYGVLELGMGVLVMPMVEAKAAGVATSRDPTDPATDTAVVEAVLGAGEPLVSGTTVPVAWHFDRQTAAIRASAAAAARRPLEDGEAADAARLAIRAEEVLGHPADVEWALDRHGRIWLLQARPMTILADAGAASAEQRPEWRVLLASGVCAAPGVGIGHVARVRGRDDAVALPRGSVMVAVEALPDLALALPRAVAIVAERGAVTGHLAATAREFGVPALLGAEGATASLGEGELVTVDASARRVYAGRIGELETRPAPAPHRPPGGLGRLARRVMPLILPLNLRDPEAEEFDPEHCRTIHDVVRYIHEKALLETVGDGETGVGGAWFRFAERLPFDLRLVPLEGGVEVPDGGRKATREQVTSVPARALIEGLLDPAVKRSGPPPIDAGGFMSVVAHSAMETELGGPTWAMVSDRYLQLSSRIGYHFATVEAFVGERESDSRVRFVFRGGAADDARRFRRARFIGRVLEGLSFQVTVKGDFVSGVMGNVPEGALCAALTDLGRLLVCASRLDMLLADDTLVDWWADAFLAGDYAKVLEGATPPAPTPST